jgi:hypothetical protein
MACSDCLKCHPWLCVPCHACNDSEKPYLPGFSISDETAGAEIDIPSGMANTIQISNDNMIEQRCSKNLIRLQENVKLPRNLKKELKYESITQGLYKNSICYCCWISDSG